MVQGLAPPLTRQLERYRHQAVAAPSLLDDGPLTPAHVTQLLTQHGVAGRNRLFPPPLTLGTFLLQVLSPDGSCREALSRLRPGMIAKGPTPCSPHTGSDCQARPRLPAGVVAPLARHRGQRLCAHTPAPWLWNGRRVKSVDGSPGSMPETEAHQAASPQPPGQHPG